MERPVHRQFWLSTAVKGRPGGGRINGYGRLPGSQQTRLVVTCTLETLEAPGRCPGGGDRMGGVLSGEAVERMVCAGAAVRRLVLDGDGVVMDFGRRKRLISPQAQ